MSWTGSSLQAQANERDVDSPLRALGRRMSSPPFVRGLLTPLLLSLLPAVGAAESAGRPNLASRYDLVVYGSTPGGIACAVRAAREGLQVLMVTHADHIGGILSSGLSTMDTLYNGSRAPIYDEFREAIYDHYRATYGEHSAQYKATLPGQPKTKFEAHIVEEIFELMLKKEPRVTLVRAYYPVAARREQRALQGVTFRALRGPVTFEVVGAIFADCSYEGDLLAVAKVPYRWGREARAEFNEEHAGRIFVRRTEWPPRKVDPAYLKDYWKLNLFHYERWYEIIQPQSTGAADQSVQAYNLRTILTRDPANRVTVTKPDGYDRDEIVRRMKHDINWSGNVPRVNQPNDKTYLNLPELVGVQHAYVEGDWEARRRVTAEHRRLVLSLIYFQQHDASVPEAIRRGWSEWGLPRDEFPSNGHVPYEIYVREGRRLDGRFRFTENDARLATGLKRAPVHGDAISITEWFLDSHACTPEELPGSLWEGELLLNNITFPGQIPFRAILPQGVDNLLVPLCASSSHIGWGAIRLEPTWMSLAEAAAVAAVIALREHKTPADIKPDELVRALAERKVLLAFFNDVEGKQGEPWYAAVQYFGTQGFFATYDARPGGPLAKPLADRWVLALEELVQHAAVDPTSRARGMLEAELKAGQSVTAEALLQGIVRRTGAALAATRQAQLLEELGLNPAAPLTRGAACRLMFAALEHLGVPKSIHSPRVDNPPLK
ncbi:MAG: FAD-dependent oxidoreductase [Undibacterium sp.]|nr:FAD-dependent oxidoreductase [Opitutaceae bacterium]